MQVIWYTKYDVNVFFLASRSTCYVFYHETGSGEALRVRVKESSAIVLLVFGMKMIDKPGNIIQSVFNMHCIDFLLGSGKEGVIT